MTGCASSAVTSAIGSPFALTRAGFGVGFAAGLAGAEPFVGFTGATCFAGAAVFVGCAATFLPPYSGLIVLTTPASTESLGAPPIVNMKTARPAAARAPTSATSRICGLTVSVMVCVSAWRRSALKKQRGRGFPRPRAKRRSQRGLANSLGDRGRRAALEVGDRGRVRVLGAVERGVGAHDADVLDPGVVGELELGQRRAGVAGGVVGVEGLHAGDGGADVGLRGRGVGAVLEAEVRRDRDREQDPEDDDDDDELDQREAAFLACDAVPQIANHVGVLLPVRTGSSGGSSGIGGLRFAPKPRMGDGTARGAVSRAPRRTSPYSGSA